MAGGAGFFSGWACPSSAGAEGGRKQVLDRLGSHGSVVLAWPHLLQEVGEEVHTVQPADKLRRGRHLQGHVVVN